MLNFSSKHLSIGLYILIASTLSPTGSAQPISIDGKLNKIVQVFGLKPIDSKEFFISDKYLLGQALFYDPLLSGNRDVSCSTCHLVDYGTSDGLDLSIGVGGQGKGALRVSISAKELHPRNSMDLWNRDHNNVSSMFWDGRIEVTSSVTNKFKTPLGQGLPAGLDNLMAAQSLFPLITPNEMLGYPGNVSSIFNAPEHTSRTNEYAEEYADTGVAILHADEIFKSILARIFGADTLQDEESWHATYLALFQKAYPEAEEISISHIANALAHFIEVAFATRGSKWDEYLAGKTTALTPISKQGAILFYGKGRCAVCHSGETFSDYNFHSIGVIDSDWRIMSSERDVGRYAVTGNDKDKYTFRTPPLRNAANTAPYFHNGTVDSLFEAVKHHVQPLRNVNRYHESGRFLLNREQADSISPLLVQGLELNDMEIVSILEFLNSLSFAHSDEELRKVIPDKVPSGLGFLY